MATVPIIQDCKIKEPLVGSEYRIECRCPHCDGELVIQESEARRASDQCPNCDGAFVLSPKIADAIEEIRRSEAEQNEAKKREEAERKKRQDQRRRESEQRRRRERQIERENRERDAVRQAEIARRKIELRRQERRKHQDAEFWEERYPNLEKYLNLGRAIAPFAAVLSSILIVASFMPGAVRTMDPDNFGFWLFFLFVTAIGCGIGFLEYIFLMASIEFVCVFCSAEEEAVNSRKLLADIASRLPEQTQETQDDE